MLTRLISLVIAFALAFSIMLTGCAGSKEKPAANMQTLGESVNSPLAQSIIGTWYLAEQTRDGKSEKYEDDKITEGKTIIYRIEKNTMSVFCEGKYYPNRYIWKDKDTIQMFRLENGMETNIKVVTKVKPEGETIKLSSTESDTGKVTGWVLKKYTGQLPKEESN